MGLEASHPVPAIMQQGARTFSLRRTRPWQPVPSNAHLRNPPTPPLTPFPLPAPSHSGQQVLLALLPVSSQHTGPPRHPPTSLQPPPQLTRPLGHDLPQLPLPGEASSGASAPPDPRAPTSLIWHVLPTRLLSALPHPSLVRNRIPHFPFSPPLTSPHLAPLGPSLSVVPSLG